jgi:predicted site-specific integrase-resolvase
MHGEENPDMPSPEATIEKCYRVRDVAGLLSVHPRTVARWVERGDLGPVVAVSPRDTRIPASSLSTWIRHRTIRRS